MDRKPDIIRAVVLVFAIGLVITGFTSIPGSENDARTVELAPASSFLSLLQERTPGAMPDIYRDR
ncbi:hypothetical protein [Marinobacter changyiensis]|uniref:hypothetical protein n=1 Tax=Marinobacter changyiensis TaxID=2604091 RepID=UPI0012650629|nr:hypothetical protein [Marinobacter changyiensis]